MNSVKTNKQMAVFGIIAITLLFVCFILIGLLYGKLIYKSIEAENATKAFNQCQIFLNTQKTPTQAKLSLT